MKLLIVLILAMNLVTGVRHYIQTAAIASELASLDAPSAIVPDDGYTDDEVTDLSVDEVVGTWELFYCEMDGESAYCDEDSAFYQTLTFSGDGTVVLTEYSYGERSYHLSLPVEDYHGCLIFELDDKDVLPESVARKQYLMLDTIEEDGRLHMTVMLMFYSSEGFIENSYTMMFEKV